MTLYNPRSLDNGEAAAHLRIDRDPLGRLAKVWDVTARIGGERLEQVVYDELEAGLVGLLDDIDVLAIWGDPNSSPAPGQGFDLVRRQMGIGESFF